MYKIIGVTIVLLMLISVIVNYSSSETADEKLSYQISKSENFKAIINYGKVIADRVQAMPDSTKNKFRALKPQVDLLLKNKSLSRFQIKDSLIKFTNLVKKESLFDSSFYKKSASMVSVS